MPYGARIFWDSNKKEPKTLVNTGVSASFIVCYLRAKSVIFRLVIVPWKPFAGNGAWVRISHSPPLFWVRMDSPDPFSVVLIMTGSKWTLCKTGHRYTGRQKSKIRLPFLLRKEKTDMLPKKRTNGSETGRQRREEKELTGAEYELPPEGCPRNLFCSLTQSPAVF